MVAAQHSLKKKILGHYCFCFVLLFVAFEKSTFVIGQQQTKTSFDELETNHQMKDLFSVKANILLEPSFFLFIVTRRN